MRVVKIFSTLMLLWSQAALADTIKPAITCKMTPAEVMVRQQVIILCDYESDQQFADITHGDLELEFAKTYKIPVTHNKVTPTITRHRFGWIFIPIESGEYEILPPPVKLDFGKRSVSLPTFVIGVNQLPLYLKPDVPVGAIAVTLDQKLSTLLIKDRMVHLRINIQATGIPLDWLTHLESKFSENTSVRFYIHRKSVMQFIEPTGLRATIQLDVGVVPHVSGSQTLLTGAIETFNPLVGRYVKNIVATKPYWVLPLWLVVTGFMLGAVLLIIVIIRIAPRIKHGLFTARQLRSVRLALPNTKSLEDGVLALHGVFCAYGLDPKLPELACYRQWTARFGESPKLNLMLQNLSRQRFSSTGAAQIQIPEDLHNTLLELTKIGVWLFIVSGVGRTRCNVKAEITSPF